MGLLSSPPDPLLFELLYEPQLARDRHTVLPHLLAIDAAHLVMLARREILPRRVAADLLAVNRDLQARLDAGEEVVPSPPRHRGLYLLYEQQYIERLGHERGGAAHVARSRNDINAAVTRMRLRRELLEMLAPCLDLATAATELGEGHAETVMSAFTHLQPAQPSSLGHYLAAVVSELLRSAEWLARAFEAVNRSPLGAAAGLGTSFPVDRELVAGLLGFDGVVANSLDAVASRDYAVQVLAALATLGTTLTRWALDFQLWGSHAYGFLGWPDELVSTSSIMPQKRNAYVWENIRGEAVHPTGALVNTLMGLKNTPFSNSVEVSGEAAAHLWPALATLGKALRLAHLLVSRVEVRAGRMREALDGTGATMTALADHLVAHHGLAFRQAHDAVGELVRRLPPGQEATAEAAVAALAEITAEATGRRLALDARELARVLDPEGVLGAARHGGGPAPAAVRGQLAELGGRIRDLRERTGTFRRGLEAARDRLAEAVRSVRSGGGDHEGERTEP